MDETRRRVEDDDEVCVLVPSRSCHLRAIRLVAAEAGGRAGFNVSELDDLRIAEDERCSTLLGASDERLLVRIIIRDGRVVGRGPGHRRAGAVPPRLPTGSELIVDAVGDQPPSTTPATRCRSSS